VGISNTHFLLVAVPSRTRTIHITVMMGSSNSNGSGLTIRIPPRIRNFYETGNPPLGSHAPPTPHMSIFNSSDPFSIAANQCRCPFTTTALSISDDAVYTASFGSSPPHKTFAKRRFLKVYPLSLDKPIPLMREFSFKLQECNSVDFNIAALSAFAHQLVNSLDVHPQLNTGSLLW
jgi:hypothetical protein